MLKRITWKFVLVAIGGLWAVFTSAVGSVALDIAIGQPVMLAPSIRHAVHDHMLAWLLVSVALAVLACIAWWKSQEPLTSPKGTRTRTAKVGKGSLYSPATTGDNSPVNINSNNTHDGVLNEAYLRRDRPSDLGRTMKVVGRNINADDQHWHRVADTDGSYRLYPTSPDAHEQRPLHGTMRVLTRPGEQLFADILRHAIDTQQAATIDGERIAEFKTFLGDDLFEELPPHRARQVELTVTPKPLTAVTNSILRIPETSDEIRDLAMATFALRNGRRRRTNQQDAEAPVVLVIDIDPPAPEDEATGVHDGNALVTLTGHQSLSIGTRQTAKRTARHLIEMYGVLRALQTPRRVEIIDYATREVTAVIDGATVAPLDAEEAGFATNLDTVQRAFSTETFRIPEPITGRDSRLLAAVAEIVTTGHIEMKCSSIPVPLSRDDIALLLAQAGPDGVVSMVDEDGNIHPFTIGQPHDMATIFGTTLDLGEFWRELWPPRLIDDPAQLCEKAATMGPDDTLSVTFAPADPAAPPINLYYTRYAPAPDRA